MTRKRRTTLASAYLAIAMCCVSNEAQAQDNWAFVSSLSLTSDYVHRGLSQSSEGPAAQFGAGVRHARGVYLNIWLSTLDTRELAPDFGGTGHEISALIGWAQTIGEDWAYELSASRYHTFETSQILDYDHTEFTASLLWRDMLRFTAAYAPRGVDHARDNAKLRGPRRAVEVAAQWPLSPRFALTGGLGYSDLSKVSDVQHFYWSAGASARLGYAVAGIALIGTDSDARERFIDGRADNRVVASVVFALGGR